MSHKPQPPSNAFFVRVRSLGRYVLGARAGSVTNPEECAAFIDANMKQIFAGVKSAYGTYRRGMVVIDTQDGGNSVEVCYAVPTPDLLHGFGLEWVATYSRYDPTAEMIVAVLDPVTRRPTLTVFNVPESER